MENLLTRHEYKDFLFTELYYQEVERYFVRGGVIYQLVEVLPA